MVQVIISFISNNKVMLFQLLVYLNLLGPAWIECIFS